VSRRSVERTRRNTAASRKTVLVALASNVTVAIVKLFGGLVSGSTAMLAEAAHSLADTANQAFLLVSIALGSRDPSRRAASQSRTSPWRSRSPRRAHHGCAH
jgi:divalent metal cation (Fe/Co/Zn/Cd) transporter